MDFAQGDCVPWSRNSVCVFQDICTFLSVFNCCIRWFVYYNLGSALFLVWSVFFMLLLFDYCPHSSTPLLYYAVPISLSFLMTFVSSRQRTTIKGVFPSRYFHFWSGLWRPQGTEEVGTHVQLSLFTSTGIPSTAFYTRLAVLRTPIEEKEESHANAPSFHSLQSAKTRSSDIRKHLQLY